MKIKVSKATKNQLNWMVAKANGDSADALESYVDGLRCEGEGDYCTDWAQGGPIIEREKISIKAQQPKWTAYIAICDGLTDRVLRGPTPLIAAMRCFVASKLGEEVEIPEELA